MLEILTDRNQKCKRKNKNIFYPFLGYVESNFTILETTTYQGNVH